MPWRFFPLGVIPKRDQGLHMAKPQGIGELGGCGETWMAVSGTAMTGYVSRTLYDSRG